MEAQQNNAGYKTALYLRLSKDDDWKSESGSITTQRSILHDYAQTKGFQIVNEYVDDGYSGTNYDRPAFQKMMRDIESGKINCVLTKDLSRLGRNSARTSDLLDEYFPLHGVRYISVTDGYDSLHLTNGIAMSTPFLVTLHEMYARDISCKIRSSFQTKMENGEYIASFAPYGYQKDPNNKNHLIVDHQVAPIVKRVFQMAADGSPPGEIADSLNREGIATPAIYRCTVRPYLSIDNYSKRREWTSPMICKMLRNIVYLGHTAQGKTTKVSFKSSKTTAKHRDDWITVKNTHDPIISEETYDIVRKRSTARRSPPAKGFHNIFSGIAECADCGRSMTTTSSRKKGALYNLCCGGYKSYGSDECSNHFIDYDLLYDTVLHELRAWLTLTDDEKEKIAAELEAGMASENADRKNTMYDITKSQKRIRKIGTMLKQLYEDKRTGEISEAVYNATVAEYEAELNTLNHMTNSRKADIDSVSSEGTAYQKFLELINQITECRELTGPLLHKFIDHIVVEQGIYEKDANGKKHKTQKIKIYYRFIGCIN